MLVVMVNHKHAHIQKSAGQTQPEPRDERNVIVGDRRQQDGCKAQGEKYLNPASKPVFDCKLLACRNKFFTSSHNCQERDLQRYENATNSFLAQKPDILLYKYITYMRLFNY